MLKREVSRVRRLVSAVGESVRFLGYRKDLAQLLQASDALIAPTRYDSYGLGVHEALCCGLPALVSAGAGVAERYPERLKRFAD